MKNKNLMNKIVAGMIAGGVLLSTNAIAFAGTVSKTSGKNPVKITDTQKTRPAVKAENPEELIKAELDKLVTAGTITSDIATKVSDFMKAKNEERIAEMEKIKNMTEAERQTYFASNPKEKTNIFDELVTSGVLTQAQSDALAAALPAHKGAGERPEGNTKPADGLKAQLDALVTAGTLTAEEETKIIDFMAAKETTKQAEMEKVKNMTETERQAYFAALPKEKPDLFAELVTAGILTQEKADAITKGLPAKPEGGKGNKGPRG